jgi:hypothetical protein
MDFGDILSRAWRIIWKHKILWIFGILAGCSQAASSGGSNSGLRFSDREGRFFDPNFGNYDPNIVILIIAVAIVVLLVLWLVAIFLGTIGRIGLIRGVVQAESGTERMNFGELFSGSMPYFWRVFGLTLLVGIVSFFAFLILGLPLVICTLGIGALCLIPITWFIQVLVEQASNAMVLENLGVMDGLRRGWDIVTKNLGSMVVMALILYLGISFLAGLIIGLPLLLALGPVIAGVVAGTAFETDSAIPAGLIVAGLCFLAYLPVLLLLSGILRSYVSSAWTLTYLRLTARPVAVEPIESMPSPS